MIEATLLWILIALGLLIASPIILGLFAILLLMAFFLSAFIIATVTIILAAIISPFVVLFEKIKFARRK